MDRRAGEIQRAAAAPGAAGEYRGGEIAVRILLFLFSVISVIDVVPIFLGTCWGRNGDTETQVG